jgi:uncharacterized protein YjhX (UPF0386 family)
MSRTEARDLNLTPLQLRLLQLLRNGGRAHVTALHTHFPHRALAVGLALQGLREHALVHRSPGGTYRITRKGK